MVSVDELTVGDHGHVFCPDGRQVYIERGGDWWTPLTPQGSFQNMRPMLRDDLTRLLKPGKDSGDPKSKADLWIVWSDMLQCWAPTAWSFEIEAARRHASRYNNGGVGKVYDWRPVKIPMPPKANGEGE